jgi:opacity protein-like surface antigen
MKTLFAFSVLTAAMLSLVAASSAQERAAAPPLEIAVTYNAQHAMSTGNHSFWLQGGAIELHHRFYRGLGVVASVAGGHVAGDGVTTAPLNTVTTVFGPRYTISTDKDRLAFFGEGLIGEVDGFRSSFPAGSGSSAIPGNGVISSANGFALQVGGGLDLRLGHHLAFRPIQASWLRTQLPNGSSNTQNTMQLGAGLVFRLGR